ncbi:MAG: hypothetical protein H6703_12975 [Myxococcales bacterium]|nr:hypothetical protein [Myxococcales bacterium]
MHDRRLVELSLTDRPLAAVVEELDVEVARREVVAARQDHLERVEQIGALREVSDLVPGDDEAAGAGVDGIVDAVVDAGPDAAGVDVGEEGGDERPVGRHATRRAGKRGRVELEAGPTEADRAVVVDVERLIDVPIVVEAIGEGRRERRVELRVPRLHAQRLRAVIGAGDEVDPEARRPTEPVDEGRPLTRSDARQHDGRQQGR